VQNTSVIRVWPEEETDVRNLILNLLELVAKEYEMEVKVVCAPPKKEAAGATFNVEISPHAMALAGREARTKAQKFRRFVHVLQTLMIPRP
jgi:hypothetical protein